MLRSKILGLGSYVPDRVVTNEELQFLDERRVLHEWRAGFTFSRTPTGNFAFVFSVFLSDLPDIKFDYNQTSFDN